MSESDVVQLPAEMLGKMFERLEENAVGNKSVEVLRETIVALGDKIDGVREGQAEIKARLEVTSERHADEIEQLFEKHDALDARLGKAERHWHFAVVAAVVFGGVIQFVISMLIEGRKL